MGIGNQCFVTGAFWNGQRRFGLASVFPDSKDPCFCLLGWEIQLYSSCQKEVAVLSPSNGLWPGGVCSWRICARRLHLSMRRWDVIWGRPIVHCQHWLSRPSSAHLLAFSLRNSPLWVLILMKMVKSLRFTLWWRTLMMQASMYPWSDKGGDPCLPPPNLKILSLIL